MRLYQIIFFTLVLISIRSAFAQNTSSPDSLKVGDSAPTFSLPDLNNNYVFLRDFCGTKLRKPWINKTKHVVVLSFFATWCGPCIKEIPYVEKLMEEYKGKPIRFYLIDVGEDPALVRPFIKKYNIKLPVLVDRYMKTSEKYGANSLPRLVVIDKNGTVIKLRRGFTEGTQFLSEMRTLISPLLAKSADTAGEEEHQSEIEN